MSRKEFLLTPSIQKLRESRAANRSEKREKITKSLKELVPDLNDEEITLAVDYLVSVRVYLSGGRPIEESQAFATRDYKYDATVDKNVGRITAEELESKISQHSAITSKLNAAVSFSPELNLIKYYTKEEIAEQRKTNIEALQALYAEGTVTRERAEKMKEIINSDCFPIGYRVDLRRKFIKPIKPLYEGSEKFKKSEILKLEKKKKGSIIKRWNYPAERIDLVYVPKTA